MTDVIVADAPRTEAPEPIAPQPRRETVARIAALVAGTAVVVAMIYAAGGWAWVVVVASLITIIMLHELGHFVTAKWSGMKATEFFVGFGPRLWSIRKGETEYGVKALPLGGYVKILGMTSAEELDPSDEPRSYVNQSTSKRVLVASAGSIVHVLIALLLAIGALFFLGLPTSQGRAAIGALTVYPHGALSPAERAGIHPGDLVLAINGRATPTPQDVANAIQGSHGAALHLTILRGGQRLHLVATPAPSPLAGAKPGHLYLGVSLATAQVFRHLGLFGAIGLGAVLVGRVTSGTVSSFVHTFSPSGIGSLAHQVTDAKAGAAASQSPQRTYSMIGALALAADAARASAFALIEILIALNISLAVLNMLPMLPLDGGHVAIALYERVRTRKGRAPYRADVNKLIPVVYAFMAFLLLFVASKMYLDIAHGVANPFG